MALAGGVRDGQLGITLQDGVLKAPVQATIAEVTLRGELDVDGAAAVPTFRLDLRAQQT